MNYPASESWMYMLTVQTNRILPLLLRAECGEGCCQGGLWGTWTEKQNISTVVLEGFIE